MSAGDPMRLADGGGEAPAGLRDLLASARSDLPAASELEKVAAGLAFPPPTPPPTSAAPGAASGTLTKTIVGVVVAGALVGGGVWLTRGAPQGPAPVQQAAPAAQPAPAAVEKPAPAPAATERPRPSTPAPPARAAPTEASLLRQAQLALRNDPAASLSLTREHRRLYPRGVLAQEREVIAIEALSRLGRSDEASKSAADFEKNYPGSAHRKKVEAATGASPQR